MDQISKMKIYNLPRCQKQPVAIEEAWEFFSNPSNLKVITPNYMGFDIISGGDRPIFPGPIIRNIVTLIFEIKTNWVTQITHIKEKEYFVDEQRFGPYWLWHHKHRRKKLVEIFGEFAGEKKNLEGNSSQALFRKPPDSTLK